MPSKIVIQPLESDRYFHIFNRGVNGQKIFQDDSYYKFFMMKYRFYLRGHVSTLAYCLLPNHFHLLIKTRPSRMYNYNLRVSNQFRKLFICYAQYYNRQENRIGNLCFRHFRRVKVDYDEYLRYLFFYIHFNPQKHRIISDFRLYQYSSYNNILDEKPSFLARNLAFGLFDGDIKVFENFHLDLYHDKSLNGFEEKDDKLDEMASQF